jgi:hypothetical protein
MLLGGGVTRGGVKEYLEVVQGRYRKATRREKGRILDEFVQVTGCHRKAVIRLSARGCQKGPSKRQGRPKEYGLEVVTALKKAWEASDRMCSRRLQPFLPELVQVLERRGELALTPEIKDQLCGLSPATMDRLLRPYRQRDQRQPFSTTKPGSLMKVAIPIRTFADWDDKHPGFLEIDLVAHCGESTEDFYRNTLSTVDVATGLGGILGGTGQRARTSGGRHSPPLPKVALSPAGPGLGQRR